MSKKQTLVENLFSEMNRVRDIINEYKSNPRTSEILLVAVMDLHINNAEKAICNGLIPGMIQCLVELKKCKLD